MILASIIGLLGSLAPHLLDYFNKREDNKQELAVLQLQMQAAAQGAQEKLAEIGAQADVAESAAIYKTYNSGIRWVDALNATVRPVLMYSFFILYCYVKYTQYAAFEASHNTLPWLNIAAAIWNQADMDLFATMITFYYGNRTFSKLRGLA